MRIDKASESQLVIGISEALRKTKVQSYDFASMPEKWSDKLKSELDPDFCKALMEKLDYGGLQSFARRFIADRFILSGEKKPDRAREKRLTDYQSFSEPIDVAREMVAALRTMPHQYKFCMRLCDGLAAGLDFDHAYVIDDRIKLERGFDLNDEFALANPDSEYDVDRSAYHLREDHAKFEENKLYFTFRTSGMITEIHESKLISEFEDQIRSFFGACMSFGILTDTAYSFLSAGPNAILVNRQISGKRDGKEHQAWVFNSSHPVENDTQNCTDLFMTREAALKNKQEGSDSLLAPVVAMFNSPENARLKTAALWLCRAHLSHKAMDKIIESTIALEVLLGDKEQSDRVGLSRLMSNRCAYALGKSRDDRRRMISFFTDYYKVRSDIVHSGRTSLARDDREVVTKGLELASRMLLHETMM